MVYTEAARLHQLLAWTVNPVTPSSDFADRLARLTYLCSEITNAAKGKQIPVDRLHDVLKEAEELCRAVRKEIARRDE